MYYPTWMDEEISYIKEELQKIKERVRAIEKEQRWIREDIISGDASSRMKKRILQKPESIKEIRKKIDKEIDIKI